MEFDLVTWQGPSIDDEEVFDRLPDDLKDLLIQINGFIQFSGGFHIRGASLKPDWHSLRIAWDGAEAFQHRYTAILDTDVPFAQDALGDQFLLRDGNVIRLLSESDEIEAFHLSLFDFVQNVQDDPIDFLSLQPLRNYWESGGTLEPGQLLSVLPPYVVDSGEHEHSYRAMSVEGRLNFLAHLAKEIRDIPDGEPIHFDVTR